jgi:Ca2+-binding RTX toxin-like protein
MVATNPAKATALFGLGGDDTIIGGNMDDVLVGGNGMDTMDGGNGSDTYLIGPGESPATYGDAFTDTGSTGYDRIVATGNNTQIVIKALSGIEEINSGGFSGVNIAGATSLHNIIDLSHTKLVGIGEVQGGGATSNDTFYTSNDSDAIGGQAYRGGNGNDTFYLGSQDTGSWRHLPTPLVSTAIMAMVPPTTASSPRTTEHRSASAEFMAAPTVSTRLPQMVIPM